MYYFKEVALSGLTQSLPKDKVEWDCRYGRTQTQYEEDDSYGSGKAQSATSGDETQSEPEQKRRRFKRHVSGYTTGEESSDAEPLSGMHMASFHAQVPQ